MESRSRDNISLLSENQDAKELEIHDFGDYDYLNNQGDFDFRNYQNDPLFLANDYQGSLKDEISPNRFLSDPSLFPEFQKSNKVDHCLSPTTKNTKNNFDSQKIKKSNRNQKLSTFEFYRKRRNSKGCGCGATKCLRRYCPCFRNGGFCGFDCACLDCLNKEEFKDKRKQIIDKTKQIVKYSFLDKIVKTETGKKINAEGCKCKSGCRQRHCGCSKNSIGCSPICKCTDCRNSFTDLNKEEVLSIYRTPNRTKEQIIIESVKNSKFDGFTAEDILIRQEGLKTIFIIPKFDNQENRTDFSEAPRDFSTSEKGSLKFELQ